MMPSSLSDQLHQFPRLDYGRTPTSLQFLPNLTQKLAGPQLWLKRDDEIGPGSGGNKGRKLEFIMADVQQKGKKKVITFGGTQSNHCQMTAAACAKLGLEAHLFFFEKRPSTLQGNLLLNELLGAKMHFIPFGGDSAQTMTLETTIRLVKLVSTLRLGPRAYFMPVGGHSVIGGLGYVVAALEIHEQVVALGLDPASVKVITAVGTGGTLAGLMAGLHLIRSPIKLLGIDIDKIWKGIPASIAHLASEICHALGEDHTFATSDVPIIPEVYAGEGFGVFTEETAVAIRTMAQTEGILLDPVFTGKAFAGVLDLVQKGAFSTHDNLIFLHSGGAPGLWSYADKLSENLKCLAPEEHSS